MNDTCCKVCGSTDVYVSLLEVSCNVCDQPPEECCFEYVGDGVCFKYHQQTFEKLDRYTAMSECTLWYFQFDAKVSPLTV